MSEEGLFPPSDTHSRCFKQPDLLVQELAMPSSGDIHPSIQTSGTSLFPGRVTHVHDEMNEIGPSCACAARVVRTTAHTVARTATYSLSTCYAAVTAAFAMRARARGVLLLPWAVALID